MPFKTPRVDTLLPVEGFIGMHRRNRSQRHFHSWGTYDFVLVRRRDGWKLCSITQHLLKSDGDPSIHGALRS